MSENAGLKVFLQANADQLNAAIAKATAKIEELGAKIKSLPSGDKEFNKLSRELARTSITQQNLIKSFDKLGTESEVTAPKLQKTADASRSARIAVSSLSIAIQDLPFGFIGVQNNLPAIIQGFGNLKTESKGLKDFFKSLGAQLIGPGGLFLAFSAGTAILTTIVQKYGSLENAINALLGTQNKFNSELEKANKGLQDYYKEQKSIAQITNDASASQSGQIAIIQSLTKKATDLTTSQKDQKGALTQLKDISNDYYGGLKAGTDNVDKIREATEKYVQVLIAKAQLQAYSDEISSIGKLVNENDRLLITAKKNEELARKRDETNKKIIESSAKQGGAIVSLKSNLQDAESTVAKLAEENFNLNNRTQELKDSISEVNNVIIKNASAFDKQRDAAKGAKEEVYQWSQAAIDWARRDWNKLIAVGAKNLEAWRAIIDKIAEKTFDAALATDTLNQSVQSLIQDGFNEINAEADLSFGLDKFNKSISNSTGKAIKSFLSNIQTVYPIMQSTFIQPIEDAFKGFLDSGKFAFEEFTKAVLDSIKQIAARLAATGIIASLAILLSGGFAAGTGTAGLKTLGAALLSSVGANTGGQLGLKPIANPNFGGIGPGGLAMSGAVSLSLRGSDLVGAINRTNTNINRIG